MCCCYVAHGTRKSVARSYCPGVLHHPRAALKFGLSNFQRGTPTPDEDGAVSFTGSPLYYVQLSISGYTDRDTLLDLLKFIEEESLGHYYVKSFAASTMQEDQKVSDEIQVKEGDLQVYMNVYLYYYDQTQVVEAPAEESAE